MSVKITRHQDLDVYRKSFEGAMHIFEVSKQFPREETYSLTDQIRRSSRSVCANLAEAWRKRRYEAAFVSKMNDSEGEAGETQTWLEFAVRCGYINKEKGRVLFKAYDEIIAILVNHDKPPRIVGDALRPETEEEIVRGGEWLTIEPQIIGIPLLPLTPSPLLRSLS